MNLQEARDFVELVAGRKIPVNFYYSTKNRNADFGAYYTNHKIWLNKRGKFAWRKKPLIEQKRLLIHEIGHGEIEYSPSRSEREYRAQVWAINRAEELGMDDLATALRKDFETWDNKLEWHSIYRVYVMAARKAKKEGII